VYAKRISADLVAYARKEGIFAGIAAAGSVIAVSMTPMPPITVSLRAPTDIIVKKIVSNPKSADLRNTAAKLMQ
jgi:lipid-binding SYLF domain-containing protein